MKTMDNIDELRRGLTEQPATKEPADPQIQSRFFHAYISVPSKSRWDRNLTLGVVGQTLQEVVAKVEALYPGVTIWSVQHRGPIHYGIVEANEFHIEDQPKQVRA